MVSDRHKQPAEGLNAVLKTARPKLFRRASITSWGKDGRKMTRTAADVNLKEFMLTVQQQKVNYEYQFATFVLLYPQWIEFNVIMCSPWEVCAVHIASH